MRRTKRGLACTLAIGFALAAGSAWAGPATDQVKAAVDRVLKVVQDPELAKPEKVAQRRVQIREVARALFDFEEMAKRSLARHWAPRSPEERKRFTELYTDLLEASYVDKIEAYGGEQIQYLAEQGSDSAVTVRSRLVTLSGTEIPIDYRLHQNGARWEVYDVMIEGVSLVSNYRSQFNKIVTQESFAALMKKLEQKSQEVAEERRTRKPATKTP